MYGKKVLLAGFLILVLTSLFAREEGKENPVRIGEVTFLIAQNEGRRAGITREPALRRFYNLNVGDIYDSAEALERRIDTVTRELNSRQVFKTILYNVQYWKEDFLTPGEDLTAHITIAVEDSFSLYLLPYVLYDSNLGMVYGGNFVYDNAFGTLTNVNLRGYGGQTSWRGGGMWENVPLGQIKGDLSLFCEQERTRRVDDGDHTVLEYTNLLLDFYLGVEIPLAGNWALTLRPGAYLPFNFDLVSYDPGYGKDEFDSLDPVTFGFLEGGVNYSNVYWEENYRIGLSGELLWTMEGPLNERDVTNSLDGFFSGFYRLLPFLGMGHHLSAFYVFNGTREGAARYMRGVLDHLMYGEWGVFINNNVDFRAFTVPPFLELHAYPLIDGGIVYNSQTPFDAYDARLAAGFGITLFPLFLQSLQLNVEVGFDLMKEGKSEVSFKSELFF